MGSNGFARVHARVVRLGAVLFLIGVAFSVIGSLAGFKDSFPLATLVLSYPGLIVIFLSIVGEDLYILYLLLTGVLKNSLVIYALAIGRSLAIAPLLFVFVRWEWRLLGNYWVGSGVGG